jgi:hypothetical protein
MHTRAAPYDIEDVEQQVNSLLRSGFEIGLHGIDAWHSPEKGHQERQRIVKITGQRKLGVRMHWLWYNRDTPAILEKAGFEYDATRGYNETIGFRNGTLQVFQPPGACTLLELPLNIQDTALFYPRRLGLSDTEARHLCTQLLDAACLEGGVLTLSWHERSLEPERLWGDHYLWLLGELRARGASMGGAAQVVEWFRCRRSIVFQKCTSTDNIVKVCLAGEAPGRDASIFVRLHIPSRPLEEAAGEGSCTFMDIPWRGESALEFLM